MADRRYSVSEATLKAMARDWFKRGFAQSGYQVHGESRLRDSAAFQSLLDAEFERVWSDRRR